MKKVFLEELPRLKNGRINWRESIGHKVKFIYDNIEDTIDIVDCKNSYLTIKYKHEIMPIKTDSFSKCKLGNILNLYTSDFKVEIETTFKDGKRDLTIIDREYRIDKSGIRRKWYKYHCNIDGNEDWIEESNLLGGQGCNVCSGKKALLGVNTIWDKARWMCDLGVSEEDAKKYTIDSHYKI